MSLGGIQDAYPFFKDGTRKRPQAGTNVNGRFVPAGAPVSLAIRCSVQAVTRAQRQEALEGQRIMGDVQILSDTELSSGSKDGRLQPDIVEVGGVEYFIKDVETWEGFGTIFYDASADRKQ